MIQKSKFCIKLTKKEQNDITKLKPWAGAHWDKPSEIILLIKDKIRLQLESEQKTCAYCGLKLKGTSRGEIEHIAAKAYYRHPEFTFILENLVLACNWCNKPEKKGNKETIESKNAIYKKCIFFLVHPYFDNPEDHYEWVDKKTEILIQIKNNSDKAKFSIEMFKLDTPEMNEHRAAQVRLEELKQQYPLSSQDEELIEETMSFK